MGCYGYPRGEPTRPISAFTETVDLMPTMLEQPEVEGELRALGYLN
jgi:arylsulfatase A-like enzyme